jgi:hypothetical protein
VDPVMRNDRQLLFRVGLRHGHVERIEAFPIELTYARTRPAGPTARRWIVERFREMCSELGTRIEDGENGWLKILPQARVMPVKS